jgi:exopolyphosphatase / guanosine-5'-triphosphate,3'-diphosphate pyrophosphatase
VRVAGIDLGTNTTRLLVADVDGGRVDEVHRESRITRLGEGVASRGRLLPVPIARVRNVLTDYRRTLEQLGAERALAVATSAVRDAENGEAFLGEVEWSYGFATRLVSGEEEAELTRRAVDPSPGTLVLDIGGGSTELVLDDVAVSLQVGSAREAALHLPDLAPTRAIGVGGTITQLAALDTEDVHSYRLSRARAREQLQRLERMNVAERRGLPRMESDRAPVIVAGASILVAVLDRYDLDEIEVSVRDILDGIALEAAELPEPAEGDAPPGAYTCC